MRNIRDTLLTLLSHEAAGLLIAALVSAFFWALSWAFPGDLRATFMALGWALGMLLVVASLRHLLKLAKVRRDLPPPGQMVDVGGSVSYTHLTLPTKRIV